MWASRVVLFSVIIFVILSLPNVEGQIKQYSLQVGAWGDNASTGNTGVQVEIRTHIYSANLGDLDYFWVGDNLANGAFIQFGYSLEPGYECLEGEWNGRSFNCYGRSEYVAASDARWEWQYWPNGEGNVFYSGKGPAYSAGFDGSWHTYSIMPNVANGWAFVLDGQPVASINDFQWTYSKDVAYFVAEKATNNPGLANLGPVEFRSLQYLKSDGWHSVNSLYASISCGVNTNCNIVNPYNVFLVGPNDVKAGLILNFYGVQPPSNGQLLWTTQVTLTLNAPYQATIVVDDQYRVTGGAQISLMLGEHLLLAPLVVPVSDRVRLKFDHWSDGYQYAGRNLHLDSDTTLEAVYVTQYKLTIVWPLPASADGWYDITSPQVMLNGWYEKIILDVVIFAIAFVLIISILRRGYRRSRQST